MKEIVTPNFDFKQMEYDIKTEWYDKQKDWPGVLVLSINDTLEKMGEKIQNYLKKSIDANLYFYIYLDDDGFVSYSLGYSVGKAGNIVSLSIKDISEKLHFDDNYSFARSCVNQVLSSLTNVNLIKCVQYSILIIEARKTKTLILTHGGEGSIGINSNGIEVPCELSYITRYYEVIKYFIDNSAKIINKTDTSLGLKYKYMLNSKKCILKY